MEPIRQTPLDILRGTILFSSLLIAAAALSWFGVQTLQDGLLGVYAPTATLVFLPFGLKMICAYYEGWWSIPFLLPGALVANALFWQSPLDVSLAVALLCSYGAGPLVFSLLDRAFGVDRRTAPPWQRWRLLIGGSLLASAGGSLAVSTLVFETDIVSGLLSWPAFALGDFLGLLAVLALFRAIADPVLRLGAGRLAATPRRGPGYRGSADVNPRKK